MSFNVIAILEPNTAADSTDTDTELEVEGRPIVSWPVNLVGCLDQYFNLSRHHCITLNFEAWPFGTFFLHGSIADPKDPRWLTL